MLEQAVERIRRVDPGDSPFFGKTGHSSEWQTRYYLVDPLLRALGWDTSCPQEVRVEWPIPGPGRMRPQNALGPGTGQQLPNRGRVDYALFAPESSSDLEHLYVPRALIEVKGRRVNLPVALSDQLARYVRGWPEMAGLAVMTNGMVWHFYEVQGGRLPEQDPVATVDLCQGSARVAAIRVKHWLGRDRWTR